MSSEELKTRISDFFASIAKGPLGEMDPSLVADVALIRLARTPRCADRITYPRLLGEGDTVAEVHRTDWAVPREMYDATVAGWGESGAGPSEGLQRGVVKGLPQRVWQRRF